MSRPRLGWSRESRRGFERKGECGLQREDALLCAGMQASWVLGAGGPTVQHPKLETPNFTAALLAHFFVLPPSREAPREAHLEIGQIAEDGRERVTVQLVPFHLPSVTSTFVPLLSPPISPSITVITSRCSTPSGTLKISWVQNRLDNIRPPVYGDASLTVNDQPQRERARQPTHGSNAGHGGLQPRP